MLVLGLEEGRSGLAISALKQKMVTMLYHDDATFSLTPRVGSTFRLQSNSGDRTMETIKYAVSLYPVWEGTSLLILHQIRGGRHEGFHRDSLANVQA